MDQNCPNVRVKKSTPPIPFYNLELARVYHDDVAHHQDRVVRLTWRVRLRLIILYKSRLIWIEFARVGVALKLNRIERCHSVERVASFMD